MLDKTDIIIPKTSLNISKINGTIEAKIKSYNSKNSTTNIILQTDKIAQNDINYKIKHAQEFLSEGKYVKFRVFLKGREMSTPELGVNMLEKIWEMVQDYADRDKAPVLEGRYVSMLVTPKK